MWLSDSEQVKAEAAVSTLQEIGDLLREARQEQGLSCEQLAQSLKMGSEQLQALEKGDLERLPEPVFIKAMTRRVASKLNLDGDSLISRLQDVLPAPETRNNAPSQLSGRGGAISAEPAKNLVVPWQRLAITALAIGAVAGGAMVVASQRRSVETASIKAATVATPPTEAPPQAMASEETSSGKLSISSQEPSWVRIRDSEGDVVYEGTLSERKTLPADSDLEILPGRPDLVLISNGDRAPRPLGPIDEVRWYRLSPEL